MDILANQFPSLRRRCGSCLRLRSTHEFLRCSKCRVFVYCNQQCQKNHWAAGHKATCRKQDILPPREVPLWLPVQPGDDPDLDARYKYILLSPGKPEQSFFEFLRCARGFNDDFELDIILKDDANKSEMDTVVEVLSERYGWSTGPTVSVVPGFRDEYDGYFLRCIHDKSYQHSTTMPSNDAAGYIMMTNLDKCRGNFVFFGRDASSTYSNSNPTSTSEQAKQDEEPLTLSRRDIISIAIYNSECGAHNTISERTHFENIIRATALRKLKKENFVTMPLSEEEDASTSP